MSEKLKDKISFAGIFDLVKDFRKLPKEVQKKIMKEDLGSIYKCSHCKESKWERLNLELGIE